MTHIETEGKTERTGWKGQKGQEEMEEGREGKGKDRQESLCRLHSYGTLPHEPPFLRRLTVGKANLLLRMTWPRQNQGGLRYISRNTSTDIFKQKSEEGERERVEKERERYRFQFINKGKHPTRQYIYTDIYIPIYIYIHTDIQIPIYIYNHVWHTLLFTTISTARSSF